MTYKEALRIKVGNQFEAKNYTGIYEVKRIDVDEKRRCLWFQTNGGSFNHKEIKSLVGE